MIHYGQGAQTIRWVPRDHLGHARQVPVTYLVVDLREPETAARRVVVASTAATAPIVSTTTTAATGPDTANPRRVSIASGEDLRQGGIYRIADGTTEETFTVATVNVSGLEIETTRPLTRSYSLGATIDGLEVTGTFPASVADDETRLTSGGGPFLALWQYTIDGVDYVASGELWLTRYGVAPWVSFDDCTRHLPGLAQYVGEAVDPLEAIRGATDEFIARMHAAGTWRRDPAYFRGNLSADLFIRKWAIGTMLRGGRGENSIALAQEFLREAEGHLNNMTIGAPPTRSVAIDPTSNVAAAGGEEQAAYRLFVRP